MLPLDERKETFSRYLAIMKEASQLVYMLSQYPATIALQLMPFPIVSRELALSFALLGNTLDTEMRSMLSDAEREALAARLNPRFVWSTGDLLLESMEVQGWCPFIVDGIESWLPLDAVYYASTLGPPADAYDHRRCSDDHCVARTNQPRHSTDGCRCAEVSPEMSDIAGIIKTGQTPVLRLHPSIDGPTETGILEVLPDQSSVPYVAISHVWSDGLGNPKCNSIPYCQLLRIQEAVNMLYKNYTDPLSAAEEKRAILPIPFWIDTLCVPNGKGLKELKDEAIGKMTGIYTNADKVLVIDAEVAACSMETDPMEILVKICLSNWLRRLWTLQEGVFAKSLHFLVTKETISFLDLLQEMVTDDLCLRIVKELSLEFKYVFSVPLRGLDPPSSFYDRGDVLDEMKVLFMMRAVTSRTSTFISDQAICLALLLGINPKPILDATEENKLQALFQCLDGYIPPGILLLPGERIETKGYRWAPRSLLVSSNIRHQLHSYPFEVPDDYPSEKNIPRPSGRLDKQHRGLKVMFPGLILDHIRATHGLGHQFKVDISNASTEKEDHISRKPPHFWRVTYTPEDEDDPPWEMMSPRKQDSQKMAIMICGFGLSWRNSVSGLLVKIVGRADDGMLVVLRICRLILVGTPEYDDFEWLRDPESSCTGLWQSVGQMWCVD